jgi:hypothetical protein
VAQPAAKSSAARIASFRDAFSAQRRSAVRNAIQQDSPGRWIVPRFVWGVLVLSVAGLMLGLAMFLLVPRVWIGGGGARYQGEPGSRQAVVGFSGEVRLGQIGQILESTERVMRVKVFDRDADKPIAIEDFAATFGLSEPLFRGAVLERYQNGRWKGGREETPATILSHPLEPGLIRQEYTLDMTGSEVLFAMRPMSLACLALPYGAINVNPETSVFVGSIEGRDPLEYYVYSKKRKAGDPTSGRFEFGELPGFNRLTQYSTERYLQRPDAKIDQLAELARELVNPQLAIDSEDVSLERRMAQTLEAHLRDSDEYAYSLKMDVEHPERDPVEEFLFVRKRGHCEYFASSMAVMLRTRLLPLLERDADLFEKVLDHILGFALVEAQLLEEQIGQFGFRERHRHSYWRSDAPKRTTRIRSSSAMVASISTSVKVRSVSCISTRIARLFFLDPISGPR